MYTRHFEYSCMLMFMYGWKQRAQRKRLNEQSTQEMYIDETFAEKFLFTNTSFERELSLKTLSCPADQKARRLCVWDFQLTTSWMCNIRWQVPKLAIESVTFNTVVRTDGRAGGCMVRWEHVWSSAIRELKTYFFTFKLCLVRHLKAL